MNCSPASLASAAAALGGLSSLMLTMIRTKLICRWAPNMVLVAFPAGSVYTSTQFDLAPFTTVNQKYLLMLGDTEFQPGAAPTLHNALQNHPIIGGSIVFTAQGLSRTLNVATVDGQPVTARLFLL